MQRALRNLSVSRYANRITSFPRRNMASFIKRGSDYYNVDHISYIDVKKQYVHLYMTRPTSVSGSRVYFSSGNGERLSWSFSDEEKARKWAAELVDEIHRLK